MGGGGGPQAPGSSLDLPLCNNLLLQSDMNFKGCIFSHITVYLFKVNASDTVAKSSANGLAPIQSGFLKAQRVGVGYYTLYSLVNN